MLSWRFDVRSSPSKSWIINEIKYLYLCIGISRCYRLTRLVQFEGKISKFIKLCSVELWKLLFSIRFCFSAQLFSTLLFKSALDFAVLNFKSCFFLYLSVSFSTTIFYSYFWQDNTNCLQIVFLKCCWKRAGWQNVFKYKTVWCLWCRICQMRFLRAVASRHYVVHYLSHASWLKSVWRFSQKVATVK